MSPHFVDLEALNLRGTPEVSATNRLAVLHLGQPVDVLGLAGDGWMKVRTSVDGTNREGFVKAVIPPQAATGFTERASLRVPVSEKREVLVAEAIRQWQRFDLGQAKEHEDPAFRFVGEMWLSIGQNLDGRDRDVPWSAACISFIVHQASTRIPSYRRFRFAAAHSRYLHESIARREANDTATPFWGFRLGERRPQIGDIVGKWRETPRDFDDARHSDAFKAHSDIIVSVGPDAAWAIGGNVGDSVGLTRYEKAPSGFLAPSDGAFMLMANITDGADATP